MPHFHFSNGQRCHVNLDNWHKCKREIWVTSLRVKIPKSWHSGPSLGHPLPSCALWFAVPTNLRSSKWVQYICLYFSLDSTQIKRLKNRDKKVASVTSHIFANGSGKEDYLLYLWRLSIVFCFHVNCSYQFYIQNNSLNNSHKIKGF